MVNAASRGMCVVAGRFNPAILIPDWIVKEGVLPAGETSMETQLGGGAVRFHLAGLMWQPTVSKLVVESEAEGSDPGEFVAQVLDRLNHTPVRGVGNNFAFELTDEDAMKASNAMETPLKSILPLDEYEPVKYSGTISLARGVDCLVGITIETEGDAPLSISFNFHRDAASAATAAEAARRFGTDRQEASRLLGVILR